MLRSYSEIGSTHSAACAIVLKYFSNYDRHNFIHSLIIKSVYPEAKVDKMK